MIEEFIRSWPLFQNTWLAGWTIRYSSPLVGVLVVARDQVFIGAAVSEASTLGVAVGMWLTTAGPLGSSSGSSPTRFSRRSPWSAHDPRGAPHGARRLRGRDTNEAITGWVFSRRSLSILVVQHSLHGVEEVHKLLSSTLIGTSRSPRSGFSAGSPSCSARLILRFAGGFCLVLTDPDMAQAPA
jgi:hypothetical protein